MTMVQPTTGHLTRVLDGSRTDRIVSTPAATLLNIPKSFRVLYFTGSHSLPPTSMKSSAAALVPGEWTLYEVDLLRRCQATSPSTHAAHGSSMLMIDDVTLQNK